MCVLVIQSLAIEEIFQWRKASIGEKKYWRKILVEKRFYWRKMLLEKDSIGEKILLEKDVIGGRFYWGKVLLEKDVIGERFYWGKVLFEAYLAPRSCIGTLVGFWSKVVLFLGVYLLYWRPCGPNQDLLLGGFCDALVMFEVCGALWLKQGCKASSTSLAHVCCFQQID